METVEPETEASKRPYDRGRPSTKEADEPRRWPRLVASKAWCGALIIVASSRGVRITGLAGMATAADQRRRRSDAQQAAVHNAQVLTSIDSNNVDQNFAEVLNGATGEFKDMYSQSSAQLRQLLVDNKATAHGVVIDSAVKSASRTRSSC